MTKLKDDLNKLLNEFASGVSEKIKSQLSWTKNLKNNIKTKVEDDKSVTLILPGYATFVEYGRKPGKQPPLNVIYSWCKSKNIDTKFAFPIAKKIGERGLKAHPFMYIYEDELVKFNNKVSDLIIKDLLDNIKGKV